MFGGRVCTLHIGMYVYCACVCHTMHVGVSMNTVPRYHFGLHACMCTSTACMLQLSHFVLVPPSRPSPCPVGGFPCGLSEVDLFRARKGHSLPSELVVSSEGAAQPEGTWTGEGVFVK